MVFGKKRSGFTLLELIIVIVVIGILASIALPRYIRIAEKGRVAEAKNMLSSIRSANMRYAAQWNAYTNNISRIDVNLPSPKFFNCSPIAAANVSSETQQIAGCRRTAIDNPGMGSYWINITMGGNISSDTTGSTVL
ncbi:MAG: prepilin-type N-terminal cleavage/methylation domain-containing protein [Candidatus Omnitrophota bacterium]